MEIVSFCARCHNDRASGKYTCRSVPQTSCAELARYTASPGVRESSGRQRGRHSSIQSAQYRLKLFLRTARNPTRCIRPALRKCPVGAKKVQHLMTSINHKEVIERIGTLGKGSFGTVTLVRDFETGLTYQNGRFLLKNSHSPRTLFWHALKAISKARVCKMGQQEHVVSERRSEYLGIFCILIRLNTHRCWNDMNNIIHHQYSIVSN